MHDNALHEQIEPCNQRVSLIHISGLTKNLRTNLRDIAQESEPVLQIGEWGSITSTRLVLKNWNGGPDKSRAAIAEKSMMQAWSMDNVRQQVHAARIRQSFQNSKDRSDGGPEDRMLSRRNGKEKRKQNLFLVQGQKGKNWTISSSNGGKRKTYWAKETK